MTHALPQPAQVHRIERAGIRTLWVEHDGDPRLALAFRVGTLDEPFARSGITHLVEHLALTDLAESPFPINGFVNTQQTAFTARGTAAELVGYLDHVASTLQQLPLDRLALERGVLAAEAGDRPGLSTIPFLTHVRWGLQAPGRIDQPELALRSAEPADLQAWADDRFTAGAATLCWVGPEPPALSWTLPAGAAAPLPAELPAIVPLPYFVNGDEDVVGVAFTLPGGIASAIFEEVLVRRLLQLLRHERGLVYDVESSFRRVTPELSDLVLVIEVDSGRAPEVVELVIAELDRLAGGAVPASDLDASRRIVTEYAAEPDWILSHLLEMATALSAGASALDLEAELAAAAATDAEAIAGLAAHARTTAIIVAPGVVPPPPGWSTEADLEDPEPVDGTVFTTRELRPSERQTLTLADDGFSLATGDDPPQTLHWADLVMATRDLDGSYVFRALDGTQWTLDPRTFGGDAKEVERRLEAQVAPELRVPAVGSEHVDAVRAAAKRDLRWPRLVRAELRALPSVLEAGEALLRIAPVYARWRPGLLAVTDRRTIFICTFGEEPQVDELRHAALTGVRIEDTRLGQVLVLETAQEARRYWGTERKRVPEQLQALIAAQRS